MNLVSAANNVAGASYPSLFSSVFSVAAHAVPDRWRWYLNPSGSTVATGNSFAAPQIAGLVALISSKHVGLTPFELKAILAATANNPIAPAATAKDQAAPAAAKGKGKGGKKGSAAR